MSIFESSVSTHQPRNPNCINERLLLAAIVRRAAFDIALYKESKRVVKRRIAVSAYNWMFNEAGEGITSFEAICDVLGQDPDWIRQQTLMLRREDVRRLDRSTL